MNLREHQLDELLDMIDWYVCDLQDVILHRVVRDLAEAEAGYKAAYTELQRRARAR